MTGNSYSPILLTGRDLTLLRVLVEAKLLDREQIQRLLDFGSITRVNVQNHYSVLGLLAEVEIRVQTMQTISLVLRECLGG